MDFRTPLPNRKYSPRQHPENELIGEPPSKFFWAPNSPLGNVQNVHFPSPRASPRRSSPLQSPRKSLRASPKGIFSPLKHQTPVSHQTDLTESLDQRSPLPTRKCLKESPEKSPKNSNAIMQECLSRFEETVLENRKRGSIGAEAVSTLIKKVQQPLVAELAETEAAAARDFEQYVLRLEQENQLRAKEMAAAIEVVERRRQQEQKRRQAELQRRKEEAERRRLEEEKRLRSETEAREKEAKAKAEEERRKREALEAAARAKEAEKQLEADKHRKAEEQKAAETAATAAKQAAEVKEKQQAAASTSKFLPEDLLAKAQARKDIVIRIKSEMKAKLGTSAQLSDAMFRSKMTITQRIGQVMNSEKKLIEIARAINQVLKDAQSVAPEVYSLCLSLLAKRVIKQAESEVAVKPSAAFALAIVCIMIYNAHPDFLDILLGRLYLRCPFIIPVYPTREKNDTDDEFRKRLAYKKINDTDWETETHYQERMCGTLALYAAIVQTRTLSHSHGIENAWTWFSRILNQRPRRITPLLILRFLEVAGNAFLDTYKGQAVKLLAFVKERFLPMVPAKAVAARTRLEIFLEQVAQTRRIDPMEGSMIAK
ncbi:hypothetical protein HDU85_003117 [Gaertneriomyces sp. JEL0708]|nr:hypothetical protein HDU85_003117 [Gaertneriomyces sp. JEL0708]